MKYKAIFKVFLEILSAFSNSRSYYLKLHHGKRPGYIIVGKP